MDERYEALEELGSYVAGPLKRDLLHREIRYGELMITVRRNALAGVLKTLRNDGNCQFHMLIDITAVDFPEREERFEVVYNLLSLKRNQRIRVKVTTDEEKPLHWMRAGQALTRVLLTACAEGLSGSFLNAPVQVQSYRQSLRCALSDAAVPQAILRLGYAAAEVPAPPRARVDEFLV